MQQDFRFLMANALWSDNGWTKIDPKQKGKHQFSWTKEHPDSHGDGTLFNWGHRQFMLGCFSEESYDLGGYAVDEKL